MNTVAFISVIFPNNLKYFNSFLESLSKQSFIKFDLLLFNDGCDENDLFRELEQFDLEFKIFAPKSDIPVIIRSEIINYLKGSGYELLIFGDTDDTFSENRIWKSQEMITKEDYDIVFNDLSIIDNKGKIKCRSIWNQRFIENKIKVDFDFLSRYNVLGLGNTSIKTLVLEGFILKTDTSIPVFDWIMFLQLLNFTPELKIGFSKEETFYRQHNQNTLGLSNQINQSMLEKSYDVKSRVYDFCNLHNIELSAGNFAEHKKFKELILNDAKQMKAYLERINNSKNELFWFEEVTL